MTCGLCTVQAVAALRDAEALYEATRSSLEQERDALQASVTTISDAHQALQRALATKTQEVNQVRPPARQVGD